jgi:hypothetical protein
MRNIIWGFIIPPYFSLYWGILCHAETTIVTLQDSEILPRGIVVFTDKEFMQLFTSAKGALH